MRNLFISLLAGVTGLAIFLFLVAAQGVDTSTPLAPTVTPTIDRLAAPPTVEAPSQADDGAQLFWLHCQPCHGDRGQGLTDEWRAQYPPEDQNCWERGCHGRVPYEDGFKLPETVPAVIGDGSLDKFVTVGQLYTLIRTTMPFEFPGYLSEEEYLAITAFLAREHGVGDGSPLNPTNIFEIYLQPPQTGSELNEPGGDSVAPAAIGNIEEEMNQSGQNQNDIAQSEQIMIMVLVLTVGLGALLLAGGAWIWRRRKL